VLLVRTGAELSKKAWSWKLMVVVLTKQIRSEYKADVNCRFKRKELVLF